MSVPLRKVSMIKSRKWKDIYIYIYIFFFIWVKNQKANNMVRYALLTSQLIKKKSSLLKCKQIT